MFYERLKSACKNANTTVTATLKAIGIGTANGTYWKNGSIPSSDVVVKLAEFLKISTDYLLLGKEQNIITDDTQELITNYNAVDIVAKAMIRERAKTLAELAAERAAQDAEKISKDKKKAVEPIKIAANEHVLVKGDPRRVEKYSIMYFDYPASAGTGLFLDETQAEEINVRATQQSYNADFAIPIRGDSMEPDYSSGDIVLIKSCPNVPIGKVGIFVLNGEVYMKEYGGDCLISYNEKYPPIMLRDFESAICLGRVLGKAEIVE